MYSVFYYILTQKKPHVKGKSITKTKNKWPLTAVSLHLPAKGHLWSILVSNIICLSSLSSSTFSAHHTYSKSINFIFLYGEYPYAFLAHLWTWIKAKVFLWLILFKGYRLEPYLYKLTFCTVSFTRVLGSFKPPGFTPVRSMILRHSLELFKSLSLWVCT